MTYRIRTATTADLLALVPLLNAAYGPRPTFESRLRAYLSVQPEGWVLAESAAGLVGVGGFVAFGRCAYIGLMAVSPQAQRRGIGAAVFEAILARCEGLGLRRHMRRGDPAQLASDWSSLFGKMSLAVG